MLYKKVYIASSRDIGKPCIDWAKQYLYGKAFKLTDDIDNCDIFISVLYDKLVSKDFIDRRNCFNFHPGILPDYRGSGAYSWVLINKEKETGVTLHKINENIDNGPIIDIQKTIIYESDTAETLYNRCMDILFQMFKTNLPKIIYNTYDTVSNNGGKVYYRRDLESAKDLTPIIKAFTFKGKESAFYFNNQGEKIYINLGEQDGPSIK